jgi:hypothetical protein
VRDFHQTLARVLGERGAGERGRPSTRASPRWLEDGRERDADPYTAQMSLPSHMLVRSIGFALFCSMAALWGSTVQAQAGDSWKDQVGKRVTVTGEAHNAKMGTLVVGDGFSIWVDLPSDAWPDGMYHGNNAGELVVVTGTVVQRADVPVLIPKEGEPMRQGVTVPPGTDLEEASKRYILENVSWKLAASQR